MYIYIYIYIYIYRYIKALIYSKTQKNHPTLGPFIYGILSFVFYFYLKH